MADATRLIYRIRLTEEDHAICLRVAQKCRNSLCITALTRRDEKTVILTRSQIAELIEVLRDEFALSLGADGEPTRDGARMDDIAFELESKMGIT